MDQLKIIRQTRLEHNLKSPGHLFMGETPKTTVSSKSKIQNPMTRVIGLMSGTSVDGIDAALVDISGTGLDIKAELIAGETYPYPT